MVFVSDLEIKSELILEATIKQIKKLRVDALYGKKRHFNAADRKQRYRLLLNIPVIILNVIIGSSLFTILQEGSPASVKILVAVLSILAAILLGLSTFLDHAKQVEGHRRVGNKYLSIVKECERVIAYFTDDFIDKNEVVKTLEKVAKDCEEVNKEAEAFHTSANDYKKAQEGLKTGEEEYLVEELEK